MKKKLFRNFFTRFKEVNVQHKIQCLKNLLQDFIKQKNILHPHTELRDILIKRSILENINTTLQEKKFFKEVCAAESQENASVYFGRRGED